MGFTLNQAAVSGNLVADPELRALPSGSAACSFRVAVNRRVKRGDGWEDEASYIGVRVFGAAAEWCAGNLAKGQRVAVAGELRQSRWESKDGSRRERLEIVARDVVPMGGARGQADRSAIAAVPSPADPPRAAAPAPAADVYDEDIPF